MGSTGNLLRWTPNPIPTSPRHPPVAGGELSGKTSTIELSGKYSLGDNSTFPFSGPSQITLFQRRWGGPGSGDEAQLNPQEKSPGVFLTWEELLVSASDRNGDRIPILSGLSGIAKPGEVLAIMGPSGCGKSTLLDALAGRLAPNFTQTGDVLLNGLKQALAYGSSAYVTQEDVLMTTLTVREAVYYAAELQLPAAMGRVAKRERAEEMMREMGLARVAGVRIGGRVTKGISGGQRRRVSICMEMIRSPKLLFLDEPTSGLDSAAAFHVMSRIGRIAAVERMTVAAAVHQPGAEVFDLFHSVCLLAYGRTVFFGSSATAVEVDFFSSNGFPCPALRNPSDHYLKTINKDFDRDIEEGDEANQRTTAESIEILVNSFGSSMSQQEVILQISKIREMGGGMVIKRNQAGFLQQTLVLTRRSFVNMYRDLGYYWLRFAIYIALCLCVGTIYHNLGLSFGSIQARGSMLSFTAAFLTFMAIGGFPSFVEDMKIFKRERLNGHYGVAAFTTSNAISATPYLALISVVPGAIAYYLVGLQQSFDHFLFFVLVLFSCMMLVEGLMMIVASLVPDFLMGIITGAGIQGVMMLNGGFFRLPDDLPKPVWRYPMYYIAFHKYANQGFYKNEFEGLTFPDGRPGAPPAIDGGEILRRIWQVEMGYSKWVDLGILLGMVFLYRVLFLLIVKFSEVAGLKFKRTFMARYRRISAN
ncbi:ABC transporter G family member 11 [Apostasia shenzhenica]|uniref:ABC transporter G family member 11 n=1 Tax=Apostasia shenzhenica TaxID=1088818 RepID=A0A2I0A5F2_9ASPA|nr:ABC transporter G family member 11 [Apostasia shenzhenica]